VLADFEELGARVIGVSLDDLDSHRRFAANHGLNFPLLADTDGAIAARFGVATRGGFAERVTFVMDREGVVAKVFPRVVVQGHAEEVLAVVRTLATASP
jgi:thioredoxin-dependent peroxiredoxin